MVGAVLSILTWAVCSPSTLPALSVLLKVIVWSPSVESVKLEPFSEAPPSTLYSVWATSDRLSVADSETVTLPFTQVLEVPLIPVVGAVRSILTAALVAVVERPAPFLTVCELVKPVPSPMMVVSPGWVGMPDSGSAAVQCTLTSPLYQPRPLGCVVGAPDR